MAMTPAERQREYRNRKKEAAQKQNLSLAEVYKSPFFEFYDEHGESMNIDLAFALMGVDGPSFENDMGPEAFVKNDATAGVDDPFLGASRSLGRTEVILDCLHDLAMSYTQIVNDFKRAEIKARLAEIEASDLSDPEKRKAALKDVARLNKMLDQLDKQVRWTFPQWKVTG